MADTANTTPTTPPAKTQVKVAGREFELKNLSVAQGMELYRALPAEYQSQADAMAHVVETFVSVQEVAARHSLSPTKAIEDWVRSAGDTAEAQQFKAQLSDAQKQASADFEQVGVQLGEVVRMIPGGEALVGAGHTANGLAKVAGAAITTTGAVVDGALNAPHVWNMLETMGAEAYGQVFGYGSTAPKENAQVFAAAVMALRYESKETRHAMPLFDANPLDNVDSQIGSHPVPYAMAGGSWVMDWLVQHVPAVEYVIAAFRFLTNKRTKSEGEAPAFGDLVQQVRAEIEEKKQAVPADRQHFDALADKAMWAEDGKVALAAMTAAEKVADMPTKDLAPVLTKDEVTYQNNKGEDITLRNGEAAKVVTPEQRVESAIEQVIGNGSVYEKTLRGGGAAWAAGQGTRGLVEGVAGRYINAPAAAAAKAENGVNAALATIEKAEASPKTSIWEFFKTSPEKAEKLKAEVEELREVAVKQGQKAAYRQTTAPDWVKTAATDLKEINAGDTVKKIVDIPRYAGRFVAHSARETLTVGGRIVGGLAHASAKALGLMAGLTTEIVGGVKNFAVGSAEGIHAVVSGAEDVAKSSKGLAEGFGHVLGKAGTYGLAYAEPVVTTGKALRDLGEGDNVAATLHTSETIGLAATMLKFGATKVAAPATAVMSTVEGINAALHDDTGGVVKAGAELGTIGSFAAAGAGVGLLGGIFAPVSVPAGAATGAIIGSVVSLWTGSKAEDAYKKKIDAEKQAAQSKTPADSAPVAEQSALSAEELGAAHEGVIEQARRATSAGRSEKKAGLVNFNLGTQFAAVNKTSIGALSRPEAAASAQKPVDHAVQPSA